MSENSFGAKATLTVGAREHEIFRLDGLRELHRPWIDGVVVACPTCKAESTRVKEVGDCWLDAGIVPFSTLDWLHDRAT